MREENILDKILFAGKKRDNRDPNDPANQPFISAMTGITNQAYARWFNEQGGEFVLNELEKEIGEKLEALVVMPVRTIEDVFKFITFRQNIVDNVNWYGKIISAFNKEESKKTKE